MNSHVESNSSIVPTYNWEGFTLVEGVEEKKQNKKTKKKNNRELHQNALKKHTGRQEVRTRLANAND